MNSSTASIEVTAEHEQDVAASAADLFVLIEGSSTFTGRSALKKAKEVAALVAALEQAGLPESAIDIQSIQLEAKAGLLGKSSAATYTLRIHVAELERLPAALTAIASAAQAKLARLEWQYPDDTDSEARLLARAAARAMAKARAIAEALGVRITAITLAQEIRKHDGVKHITFSEVSGAMRPASSESLDLGLHIQHSRKVRCEILLHCAISGP